MLRVKAANSDGVWDEEGLSLPIHVDAPPWRTPWAYLVYMLMAGSAILGFDRLSSRKLQREEQYSRRLEHEVEERSAELTSRTHELEELNEKLVEASLTDPLTGLANRRFLVDYVKRETSLVERRYGEFEKGIDRRDIFDLMFMMIDLDDFKSINDTCGHEAGDRVLVHVRDVLYEACRKSDLVVRWGGGEFLIVGRDSTPDGLEALAERIRSKIEEHAFDLGAGRFAHTTCSIGFASYPFAQTDIGTHSWEKVINVADRALYAAKRTCRNSWVGLRINGSSSEVIPDVPEGLEVHTSIPEDIAIAWN